MRKREMKVGMKVVDLEFKWGTGTITEIIPGRVIVEFKRRSRFRNREVSYDPYGYRFLKKVE